MVVIKLQNGSDIRRITVQEHTTLQALNDLTKSEFQKVGLPSEFVYQYQDPENDTITVSNDLELDEAFRLAGESSAILKLTIQPIQKYDAQSSQCPLECLQNLDFQSICHKLREKKKQWKAAWRANSKCGEKKNKKSKDERKDKKCLKKRGLHLILVGLVFLMFCKTCFCILPFIGLICAFFFCKSIKKRWNKCCTRSISLVQPRNIDSSTNSNSNSISKDEVQTTELQLPFQEKLKQLEEMGFSNRAKNVEVLVKNGGDILKAVKDLLEKRHTE